MSTDSSRPFVDVNEPTKAECQHVLDRVYAFLDHEVDTATGDEIRAHLSECEPCLDRFDVEQAVKSLVKRCCGNDKAPERLRVSIMTKIQVTRTF
ncbi:MAG TPA: mycothiol system anti-sigma-R factor [Friedmanniella sp.]